MAELKVTELDFDEIKTNLRSYLASQTEFADYDFEGSALSVLLDVLAYNTHYNAILANMQANEMFIDTAIKRSSVISIAKTLGYIPRSTTSAKARVDLSVTRNTTSGSTLSITPSVKFGAQYNNQTFTFNVNETQTATVNQNGKFVFTDVELIEGVRLSNSYVITPDIVNGPLVIPVNTVDITTIQVLVQNSVSDLTTRIFTRETTIVDVTNTSQVFWVEENNTGTYQLIFGDDNIGKQLTPGNIVLVTYLASQGPNSNGSRNFTLIGDIDGENQVDITILSAAAGGAVRESIDSVRFNAPKFNASRNRAVTAEDYKTLIKQNYNKTREVVVWGGEENEPPIYGKVFISIDPVAGAIVTEADKDFILENILRPRSVMSIQHEFVDPDYVFIGFDTIVNYNPKLTSLKPSDLAYLAKTEIEDYFNTDLGTLDRTFFLSKLSERVNGANSAFISSLFKMHLQKRITIGTGRNSSYSQTLNYLAAIDPETIKSSLFETTINGLTYQGFIQDFSDTVIQSETGTGTLKFINILTNEPVANIGVVDYEAGLVNVQNLNVTRYLGNLNQVYLTLNPQPLYQNITSGIVRTSDMSQFAVAAKPAKNTILTLDNSISNSDANISAGLTVTAKPYTNN
jgi:hypothetical protein